MGFWQKKLNNVFLNLKVQIKGYWSIVIQQNWRILFTIDQDPVPTLENGGINLKAITIIRSESVVDPH